LAARIYSQNTHVAEVYYIRSLCLVLCALLKNKLLSTRYEAQNDILNVPLKYPQQNYE
jgi:hypothetical protein